MDRRNFLRSGGVAATAAALGLSPRMLALAARNAQSSRQAGPPPELASPDSYANEELFWRELRKQFLIPADEVYLNNGTVGSSPWPVLNAVFEGYRKTERMEDADPEDYPIWGYGDWNEFRDPLARFVGAERDEIALLRNATEANSYIANGLEMKAGDEVLMSDQEHPGRAQSWTLRARRYGGVVKKFQPPRPPKNAAEILNRISDAITPRTRIIFVSHITTVTGVVLPVKQIASLARSKGILSAIDG